MQIKIDQIEKYKNKVILFIKVPKFTNKKKYLEKIDNQFIEMFSDDFASYIGCDFDMDCKHITACLVLRNRNDIGEYIKVMD